MAMKREGKITRRDYDCAGLFKMHAASITEKKTRPLFPGACQCNPSRNDSPLNPHYKDLSLVDLLTNVSSLRASDTSSRSFLLSVVSEVCIKYLQYWKSSVIFHPGQLEVLRKESTTLIIFVDKPSVINFISICVALISSGVVPSPRIYMEGVVETSLIGSLLLSCLGCLPPTSPEDKVEEQILDDINESSHVILARESSSLIEKLISLEQDVKLTQAVESQNLDESRIDFNQPFSLKQFVSNSALRVGNDMVQDLCGHLHYTRLVIQKPSLRECLYFLNKYKLVVSSETNLPSKISTLRELVQKEGGDLAFTGETDGLLENVELLTQSQGSTCTGTLKRYFLVESVLSVSILSLLTAPIRSCIGYKELTVNREKLLDRAEDLYKLLGLQNVCQRPCENTRTKLNEGLSKFESRDVVSSVKEVVSSHSSAVQARKIARDLDSDSDEESGFCEDVKLNISTSQESLDLIQELAGIVREDILKLYYCCLKLASVLNTGSIRVTDFSEIVLEYVKCLKEKGIGYGVVMEISDVEKTLDSLVRSGVVDQITLRGERWIVANDDFSTNEDFTGLVKIITLYHVY